MIVLLLSVALALSMLLAVFSVRVGEVTEMKARAQLAADGAALAAAAESLFGGGGDGRLQAESYARRNGATLVSCDCPRGASVVEVEVSLADASARARAEVDPRFLRPADLGVTTAGLRPRMRRAVDELLTAAAGEVYLVSGFRSHERQVELWEAALLKYGDPEIADDWVARPGSSLHEVGLAVDLAGNLELAAEIAVARGLPLYRPLYNEPWHFELLGSRS